MGGEDDNNYDVLTATTNKAGRIIKPPRPLTAALKVFDTAHYRLYNPYDPSPKNQGREATGKFTKFDKFDHYTLYMNPGYPNMEEIPFPGIRLDDRTAAKALEGLRRKLLHARWPAEFDGKGMLRATRIPLGHAAKKLVEVGEIDVAGNAVQAGQEGWYYLWWGGIHCLMGKEGYDAGLYLIRPSHEDFICPGLGFKLSHKAVVQLPSGDPNDPTFK